MGRALCGRGDIISPSLSVSVLGENKIHVFSVGCTSVSQRQVRPPGKRVRFLEGQVYWKVWGISFTSHAHMTSGTVWQLWVLGLPRLGPAPQCGVCGPQGAGTPWGSVLCRGVPATCAECLGIFPVWENGGGEPELAKHVNVEPGQGTLPSPLPGDWRPRAPLDPGQAALRPSAATLLPRIGKSLNFSEMLQAASDNGSDRGTAPTVIRSGRIHGVL